MPNVPQKGKIIIKKTGEVFSSVKESDGFYQPVYALDGLAGAEYQIIALEDIYTPDGTLSLTVTNKRIIGKVQVIKISSKDHGKKLSGAEFEIYLDINGNKAFDPDVDTLYGKLSETETGVYELDGLTHGGYLLFESKAPEGFQKDDRFFYFQIASDGEVITIENERGVGFVNEPVPTVPGEPSSPQTGDNSHIWLWILLASGSLAGVIAISIVGRKKRKSL